MADVAEQWLERHVRSNKLRGERERARIINRYIVPNIGNRIFADVRRANIAELLDRIEDQSGKPMADGVLKTFRAIAKWVQLRDETYSPPLTVGMSRVPKGRAGASEYSAMTRYGPSGAPRANTAISFGWLCSLRSAAKS